MLVGGDFQGKNPAVQNAQYTDFAQGASIKADATDNGDGGKVIVWADEATSALGAISAMGGANGGDGGFVEVSGKQHLQFAAKVDTSAPLGKTGTLLLDPTDITIVSGSSVPAGGFAGGTYTGIGTPNTIGWTEIEAQLVGNNVVIQTSSGGGGTGNIYIFGSPTTASLSITHTSPYGSWVTYSGDCYNSSNNLSLFAENAVNPSAPFGNAGTGAITIIAGWNGNLVTPGLVPNYTAGKDINFTGWKNIITNGALTLMAADTIRLWYAQAGDIDMNAGTLTMVANRIVLDASLAPNSASGSASIYTNGDQYFTIGRPGGSGSDGLFLYGADGSGIYGCSARIERFGGSGGQSFTFLNGSDLYLEGGAGDGLVPAGQWSGKCYTGHCSENSARIENYGSGNQTFDFVSGGTIQLLGGSGGNSNYAEIDSSTAQIVTGNPAITIQGGSSGGYFYWDGTKDQWFSNDAGFDSDVSQTINAASITLTGGSGAYSSAYLGAPVQNINVIGDVILTGGSAPAPSGFTPSGEFIDTSMAAIGYGDDNHIITSHTLNLTVGGDLTMNGGAVNSFGGSPAFIGGYLMSSDIAISTAGGINLNGAGPGRDMIGSLGGYGGYISLDSGDSINLGQGFVGTGTTGSLQIMSSNIFSQSTGGGIQSGDVAIWASDMNIGGAVTAGERVYLSGGGITVSGSVVTNTFGSSSETFDLYGSIIANGAAHAPYLVGPWSSSTGEYLQAELYAMSAFTNHGGTITTPNGGWIVTLGDGVVGSPNAIGTGPVSYADLKGLGYFWTDPAYEGLFGNFHFYYDFLAISAPIDPCQLNPSACVDKTVISNFDNFLSGNVTNIAVSDATGDVTFAPSLTATAENGSKGAATSARIEAKHAEDESKKADAEAKKAEAEEKAAKTPEDKARAKKLTEKKKIEAEEKKADAEEKKAEAEAREAEAEAKTAKTSEEKSKAEVRKTEAEGKKAEAESRKAEAEVKKAEGEAKVTKSPEKKVEAEKRAEAKKAESEAKKAEAESKRSEAEAKKAEVEAKKAEAEVKEAKSGEKKAEAEKKAENKKAEVESKKAEAEKKKDEATVKKAEAQKKETEHKKAEEERKEAAVKAFSKTTVSSATKDYVKNMIEIRHEYKTEVLKPALTILDKNPAAADMPACGAGSAGACIQQPTPQMATLLQPPSLPKVAFLPQIQRKIAVVIGVNKYQDKSIPALEGAVPDADAVGKMFQEQMGYEVRVVHDGTKAEIVQAINKVASDVGTNDSVTIYYAGHGYEVESTKTGYWIPSDGSAKSPANWISNSDINKMLSNIPAKQVMMVSDSCFSGSLAKEQKVSAVAGTAQDILGKRSVLVMSSGGEEPVSDEGRDGHSVFAWHFMDNMKSISKYEQGSKLYEGVKAGIAEEGFPQSPQYGASVTAGHATGGDYLFEVRKY